MDADPLVLRHESHQLTLDPARGGTVREWHWRGLHILRPTPNGAINDPFARACFPMTPYVNRVAGGSFRFGGRIVTLSRNTTGIAEPIHGQGWRVPWAVMDNSATHATMRFEGGADEWPWRYRAEQQFRLHQDGITVDLSAENLSETLMPVTLGLHPYFDDSAHAQLQARLPEVWLTSDKALPVAKSATPAAWCFDAGRPVNAVPLDHSFTGWDGHASLKWPDRLVTLRGTNTPCRHVYTPPGQDYFCIEPVSAAAGALNRDRQEAAIVPPQGRFAVSIEFTLRVVP